MDAVSDHRVALERRLGGDLRNITAQADWMARAFAERHQLSANEFRALLFIVLAETDGPRLTAGELARQMGLSGAAITYLIARMTKAGHVRVEGDPNDKRKVILRHADPGREMARGFFRALGRHEHAHLADLPDEDLHAAHRTLAALTAAMVAYRSDLSP